jgi:Ca2+-binding EF-hand superfamily protein
MKTSTFIRLMLTTCLAVLTTSQSLSQNIDPKRDALIEERFKAADKNGDGKLTLEEAKAGMPRVAANFDRIDVQKLGYITVDQIKKMAASQ